MPQSILFLLALLLPIQIIFVTSSPLSTIAISRLGNQTIVCALFPSDAGKPYPLNCTSYPIRAGRGYPSGSTLYSAIAAGDGFLCALGSAPSSNISTMRWWDFRSNDPDGDVKRVYRGPRISALSAGDSKVCGVRGDTGELECWRWESLHAPAGLKLSSLAVGGDFVCGLLDSGAVGCFGGDAGVVGKQPAGNYSIVAAGSSHACAISREAELVCWGAGAPNLGSVRLNDVQSLALGENRTCARRANGTVVCFGCGSELPADLANAQFMAIEAKGGAFCGILMSDYSLRCWGSEIFRESAAVFDRVLPGTCTAISSCRCGVLAGSAGVCANGNIVCQTCRLQIAPSTANSTPPPSGGGTSNKRTLVLIISGSSALGLAAVLGALFFWVSKRSGRVHDSGPMPTPRARSRPPHGEDERRLSALMGNKANSTVQEFSLQALLHATGGFSDDCRIGSGSFGTVYRAKLDGRVVAIKRASSSGAAEETAFVSELALLSRVNHKSLVRLLGFCKESGERLLVYEFMANGSLHDHLHAASSGGALPPPLASWAARIRLALDAARGMEYLHTYAVPPIIHRDVKSSNILLDESWTAKVADFGLSLMSPGGDESSDGVSLSAAGTVGYMDPEYYRLQHLTSKSDVYSFGVVLLELLSGCRAVQRGEGSGTPINVVEFAVPHIEAGAVSRVLDRRLRPPTASEGDAVAFVGYLAADCVNPQGRDRPTMTEIVGGLERALAACVSGPRALQRSTTARSM